VSDAAPRCPMTIENHHLHRRAASRPDRCALVLDGPMDGEAFSPMSNRRSFPSSGHRTSSSWTYLQASDRGRHRQPAPLQSHRNGPRQAQCRVARRRSANYPRPLASHRRRFAPLHLARMRQLSRRRRLQCNVNGKCSNSRYSPCCNHRRCGLARPRRLGLEGKARCAATRIAAEAKSARLAPRPR
jgi:hypothetical protein